MEILSNIWSALSTENEVLINILSVPCTFFEIYIIFMIFTGILRINYTKKQSVIFICLCSIASLISYYIIPAPYYSLFDYIIMFILIKNIFKTSTIKTIFGIILSFFAYTLVGLVVLNTFLKVFKLQYQQINIIPIYRLLYLICIYSLIFIFIKLLNIKQIYTKVVERIDKSNKYKIIINIVLAFLTLCVQLVITFYYMNTINLGFAMLNILSLIAYLSVSLISLNRAINLQIRTEQLENAENYNNSLLTLYDSVKGFKHDLDNMIHIIGGYIETNDMEGLKIYYNGLRKDCVRVNNIELLNPNTINNPGIYSLIVAKQNRASELKVNMSLEVFFDFNNIKMPVYEFSRILGILLDNAIEAASECTEKQVNLMFRESPKNSTQIICIENTYNNKDVDTKTIFEKGVTGKDNHTGIGLWEVNQIISKNNNIVLHTSKNNKYFKQQLEIYY